MRILTRMIHVPVALPVLFWLLIKAGLVLSASGSTNLSVWAYPGASGRMIFQPDALGNRVLDYSGVGYKGGTVPIPNVTVKTNLSPVAGDNGPVIQAAINYVATLPLDANGFRGAVLLSAGIYPISNSISINASGIVLRGSGSNTNGSGTVLRAAGPRPGADVATNSVPLIIISGSGSASTSGTVRNITNNYVPVGAYSFNVDSTSGLAVGNRVMITRASPVNWIQAIGMDQVSPAWTAGSFNVPNERYITRIEGNIVMVDVPLTCAIESQYGGATIQTYAWSGRINNVGVEDVFGVSDFNPAITTNTGASSYYYSDEQHAMRFIEATIVENAWVRRVASQYFAYSCVTMDTGARNMTVCDSSSLDPVSIITGERRYAFGLGDARNCLVQNCYTRNDRHQFVTDSLDPGPNVFVDGVSDLAYNDCGPHFRWGTGAIWDNVYTSDTLEANNYGNEGTSHGWSGANEVDWNCAAGAGFIVQNPPTARNWLIGGIGSLQPDNAAIPPNPAPGTYDSLGTNVFPNSLYYAQLQDRLAGLNPQVREYWVGQIDQFVSGPTGESVPVNSTWLTAVQAAAGSAQVNSFDIVTNNQWVPFTFSYSLATTDRIVGATLSVAMRSYNSNSESFYLNSIANSNSFSGLGWTPISSGTNTTVRTLDLGNQLNLLTNGILNVAIAGDVGIDWAMLELQVTPVQTLYTNYILPVADAYVRGGTNAVVNYGTNITLDIQAATATNNQRQAYLRWNLAGFSTNLKQARVRLTPVIVGINALENGISLTTNNSWSESTINWVNQPGGGKRFATWIPVVNVPIEVIVTPQVQAALAADGQLTFKLFSLTTNNSLGLVSYASRVNASTAYQPQLLLIYTNIVPVFSGLTNATNIYGNATIILSGNLGGTNGGTPIYPAIGEVVNATINGHSVSGTVTNATGGFSIVFNDASLATNSVNGSPYVITYNYAGNGSSLTAAGNDTSTMLMVNPAPVTIASGITANSKTYDGTNSATISSNNVALGGVTAADTNFVALSTNGYTATFNTAGVGTNKPVTLAGLSLTGIRAANYALVQPTNLTATIYSAGSNILLTIYANNTHKVYGQAVTFTGTEFTTIGLTNFDSVTSVTLTSSGAVNTANTGSYVIAPTNAVGSGLTSYTINYVNGTLTVTQAVSAFTNLPLSQAIPVGTTNVTLAGSVTTTGPVSLTNGTPISIILNGATQNANATNGNFSIVFNTAGIPASGLPYIIQYIYSGDNNYAGVTNISTDLAVYNPTNNFVWSGASGMDLNWATFGNWLPIGVPGNSSTVLFTNAGTTAGATSSNNVVNASLTLKSVTYSQTNNCHNTFINPGVILTVLNPAGTNLFLVGTETDLGANQQVTNIISGAGGTLSIVSTNVNSAVVIRQASTTAGLHNALLDMSSLDTFNFAAGNILIGVQGQINRAAGTWLLAKTNSISLSGTGTALDVGDLGGNGGKGILQLGYSNAFYVDAIKVAGQKSVGILQFNPNFTSNIPMLYLRGNTNSRVSLFATGDNSTTQNSGSAATGTVDFSGGILDGQVDTLFVGRSQSSPSGLGVATGTWTFNKGNLNVNTLEVAYQLASNTGVNVFGTVNVNGSATLVVNASLRLGHTTVATNQPVAVLNLNGGNVQANQIITETTNATINITNGILTVNNTVGTAAAPLANLNLSSGVLQFAPTSAGTNVFVKTMATASLSSNSINITALPAILNFPSQFKLIKYSSFNNNTNLNLGTLPVTNSFVYQGYLSNNVTSGTIDLVIVTNGPPPGVLPPQFVLIGLDANGNCTMSGTGPTNVGYRIFATTNLALPFMNWVPMATGTFGGGTFNYTDTLATNYLLRAYRVVSP